MFGYFSGLVFIFYPQATSTDHGVPRTSDLSIERRRRNHFTTTPQSTKKTQKLLLMQEKMAQILLWAVGESNFYANFGRTFIFVFFAVQLISRDLFKDYEFFYMQKIQLWRILIGAFAYYRTRLDVSNEHRSGCYRKTRFWANLSNIITDSVPEDSLLKKLWIMQYIV